MTNGERVREGPTRSLGRGRFGWYCFPMVHPGQFIARNLRPLLATLTVTLSAFLAIAAEPITRPAGATNAVA